MLAALVATETPPQDLAHAIPGVQQAPEAEIRRPADAAAIQERSGWGLARGLSREDADWLGPCPCRPWSPPVACRRRGRQRRLAGRRRAASRCSNGGCAAPAAGRRRPARSVLVPAGPHPRPGPPRPRPTRPAGPAAPLRALHHPPPGLGPRRPAAGHRDRRQLRRPAPLHLPSGPGRGRSGAGHPRGDELGRLRACPPPATHDQDLATPCSRFDTARLSAISGGQLSKRHHGTCNS